VTTSPLRRVDYADTYRVARPEPTDAPSLCSMIPQCAPRWLDLLLSARDKVAGPPGLSTQEPNYHRPMRQSVCGTFGPLTVQSVAPNLVACGNTDKHLAFRARVEVDVERQRRTYTAKVQFLDALCRTYSLLFKPFPKRNVPARC
jgi:Protein of unknown function (DUF2867)